MGISIPGTSRPNNLHLSPELRVGVIDGDLYNICGRIAEISPNLFIIDAKDHKDCAWIIMEKCSDGVDRMIFKVQDLDARVVRKLREIMSVSLATRVAQLEKENLDFEEQHKADELDKLYETMGRPMWTQLEHDGFIQRGVSYPKKGIK
jgi:hypothetical protein